MYTLCDIRGLDRARVLAALFNASRPLGMGYLQSHEFAMTFDEARALIAQAEGDLLRRMYFDYVRGRVMKLDLKSPDYFDPRLYDRDNGQGAAGRVIKELREADEAEAEARFQANNRPRE